MPSPAGERPSLIEAATQGAVEDWQRALRRADSNPQAKDPSMRTPAVLRWMGAQAHRLNLPRTYQRAILGKHGDVPESVFENLPALLADPLFVIQYSGGGLRVFVDATTAKGEPIFIGVGVGLDGRIQTVSPLHDLRDLTGTQAMGRLLDEAATRPGRIYARNKEALEHARASAAAAPARIALHRDSISRASVLTRIQVVNRVEGGRRPDLPKYSVGPRAEPARPMASKASVQAALRELVASDGDLPSGLGRVVVADAAEIASEWEPLIGSVGQEPGDDAGRAQGFYDPRSRTVFVIADRIAEGDEKAVLAHELMHKHGLHVLGEARWRTLHATLEAWGSAPEGSAERRVYDEAAARVQAAQPDAADRAEYSSQELFPYAVQVAMNMGIKPNLPAKTGWIERWLGEVKSALSGVYAKITGRQAALTAQDLVNLAFGIAQRENPANALAMGVQQTDTPEFRKWFGDSKVVSDEGKPLVVYHGTAADVTAFDLERHGEFGEDFGAAAFFCSSPGVAGGYALRLSGDEEHEQLFQAERAAYRAYTGAALEEYETNGRVQLDGPNLTPFKQKADEAAAAREARRKAVFTYEVATADANLMPVYLSLQHPHVVEAKGLNYREVMEAAFERAAASGADGIIVKSVSDAANEYSTAVADVYVAFKPEQIKSAIGNRGTFDPTSADIRFSKAGEAQGDQAPRGRSGATQWRMNMTPQEAHELNVEAAQRELDARAAQGEDVSGLRVCEKTAAIRMTDQHLAAQLDEVAMTNFWSDKVVREGELRLSELLAENQYASLHVTTDRVLRGMVACKLALHGVRESHHTMKDAATVLMLEAEARLQRDKQLDKDAATWKEQMAGLRELTDSLNGMHEQDVQAHVQQRIGGTLRTDVPRVSPKAPEWVSDVLADLSHEENRLAVLLVNLERGTAVVHEQDVWFLQERRGKEFELMHGHLSLGDELMWASSRFEPVDWNDEGPEGWADYTDRVAGVAHMLQTGPGAVRLLTLETDPAMTIREVGEARNRDRAQALLATVARDLDCTLSDWVQSEAREWSTSHLTSAKGAVLRVGVSDGGTVSIGGDPYTPDGERRLNVTRDAVETSLQTALHRAPVPRPRLRVGVGSEPDDPQARMAWGVFCGEENRLAGYMSVLPDATAVVRDGEAYWLAEQEGSLVLMRGAVEDGKIHDPMSRHDDAYGLRGLSAEEINAETAKVSAIADDFLLATETVPELWETMTVALEDDTPSLGM